MAMGAIGVQISARPVFEGFVSARSGEARQGRRVAGGRVGEEANRGERRDLVRETPGLWIGAIGIELSRLEAEAPAGRLRVALLALGAAREGPCFSGDGSDLSRRKERGLGLGFVPFVGVAAPAA